jgi:hypothetical protein
MLEHRDMESGRFFRAFQDTPRATCPDGTLLVFGGGRIEMKSNEWFSTEKAIDVFLAFFKGQEFPEGIRWREITESVICRPPSLG